MIWLESAILLLLPSQLLRFMTRLWPQLFPRCLKSAQNFVPQLPGYGDKSSKIYPMACTMITNLASWPIIGWAVFEQYRLTHEQEKHVIVVGCMFGYFFCFLFALFKFRDLRPGKSE